MFDDDEDYETENLSGNDLVKALRKQLSAASKQLKEQSSVIAELQTVKHQNTVAEMLKEYGLNPKIAAFIPDDVESDSDLTEWLDEYGEAFGIEQVTEQGVYDDDPDAQASELMASVEDGGIDTQAGYDLMTRMGEASSEAELMALIKGR